MAVRPARRRTAPSGRSWNVLAIGIGVISIDKWDQLTVLAPVEHRAAGHAATIHVGQSGLSVVMPFGLRVPGMGGARSGSDGLVRRVAEIPKR